MKFKRYYFFLIGFIILILDQSIKYYINAVKPSYWIFHYASNTGAVFGLFRGWNKILALFTLIIISIIIYLYITQPNYFKETSIAISAAFIVGGAAGNLIDRILFGYVIDYINLGFWPIFNLADVTLTIGILILLVCCWEEK